MVHNEPMSNLENELREAETDLAFALAQGDGYAEDEAYARVQALKARIESGEA